MKTIGDGRTTGLSTGLGIGEQFANAVPHSLRTHPRAITTATGFVRPIDEKTWQEVFRVEFPDKRPCKAGQMQALSEYCRKYYNGGAHGLGYDLDRKFDFGEGRREKQSKGLPVVGTELAIHPGRRSYVTPDEVIALAKALWDKPHETETESVSSQIHSRKAEQYLSPNDAAASEELDSAYRLADGDERRVIERQIKERRGQQQFRNALRKRYGDRCLVTGCRLLDVLEAAHLRPYRGERDNHPENGLLLRADIHTLFDLNLLGIHPTQLKVALHSDLVADDTYGRLQGVKLLCRGTKTPSGDALKVRFQQFEQRQNIR